MSTTVANEGPLAGEWIVRKFDWDRDLKKVLNLWSRSGEGIQLSASDQPDELREKLDRDPDLFLVASSEDQLLGAVLGGFDGRRGMIYHLVVDQRFRRRGIGLRLMAELEDHLRAEGWVKYCLLVTPGNAGAGTFYGELGCERMDLQVYGKSLV